MNKLDEIEARVHGQYQAQMSDDLFAVIELEIHKADLLIRAVRQLGAAYQNLVAEGEYGWLDPDVMELIDGR